MSAGDVALLVCLIAAAYAAGALSALAYVTAGVLKRAHKAEEDARGKRS